MTLTRDQKILAATCVVMLVVAYCEEVYRVKLFTLPSVFIDTPSPTDWFWLFLAVVYFVPTLVAINRGKKDVNAIGVLNFFLGWSFVGWVVALVWATKKD